MEIQLVDATSHIHEDRGPVTREERGEVPNGHVDGVLPKLVASAPGECPKLATLFGQMRLGTET